MRRTLWLLTVVAEVKNPPVVFARQANISNGPQQVNNGPMSNVPHARVQYAHAANESITRLSATGAHPWMAGWTPCGLPTRPPIVRRLPTSSTGPPQSIEKGKPKPRTALNHRGLSTDNQGGP